jgi:Nucleotidyl transferase AbiEii toxin, Type IV TA system
MTHLLQTRVTCGPRSCLNLAGVEFPTVRPKVMSAERTFWEKATAIHVFCSQGRPRGERFARHWYDVVKLAQAGYVDLALKDKALANAVATHKLMFFPETDALHKPIDYISAVAGNLRLVPIDDAYPMLSADYDKMQTDGLLFEGVETFEAVIEICAKIERRANFQT